MNLRAVIALFFLTGSVAVTAPLPPSFRGSEVVVESQTRQFTVRGPAGAATPLNRPMRTQSRDLLTLDPSATAVSAERVKQALLEELGLRDRFSRLAAVRGLEPGRIVLNLSPRQRLPLVSRTPVHGGWTYQVDLPVQMTAHAFNEVLVQVLLVDLTAPDGAAAVDLPLWLSAGLVAHLEESAVQPLFLDAGLESRMESRGESLEQRNTKRFRTVFQSRTALSFEELSWPENVGSDEAGLFKPSAQFFVYALLRLPNGRDCLRTMVQRLARYRNWQFAFHEAFAAHFKEPKDVEKWWAVQLAAVTGRDLDKLWTDTLSLTRLEEALRVPVQIQFTGNRPPETSAVTLQNAVTRWNFTQEQIVLQRVARDLDSLRLRVAPDVVDLVDGYRLAIANYRSARDPQRDIYRGKSGAATSALYEQRAFQRRLDELDAQRQQIRQKFLSDLGLHEAERRVAVTNALSRAEPSAKPSR